MADANVVIHTYKQLILNIFEFLKSFRDLSLESKDRLYAKYVYTHTYIYIYIHSYRYTHLNL